MKQKIKRTISKFYFPLQKGQLVLNYHTVPKNFEEQVELLDDNISITFDDGFLDNYTKALPILKKYNKQAIFFISTKYINKIFPFGVYRGLKMMNKEQIKELSDHMIIGCHGHEHLGYPEKEDAKKSKNVLEEIINKKVDLYAYPFGQKKNINKKIIENLGFKKAYTAIWGFNYKNTNPFELRRIRIDDFDTIKDFKSKIKGKWNYIRLFQEIK